MEQRQRLDDLPPQDLNFESQPSESASLDVNMVVDNLHETMGLETGNTITEQAMLDENSTNVALTVPVDPCISELKDELSGQHGPDEPDDSYVLPEEPLPAIDPQHSTDVLADKHQSLQ
ncbi:hypothetical protein FRC11_014607, partial [Ceratobasidium sp. 423]